MSSVSLYWLETTRDQARAAYLADYTASVRDPRTRSRAGFERWIGTAITTHAALDPHERRALADALPAQITACEAQPAGVDHTPADTPTDTTDDAPDDAPDDMAPSEGRPEAAGSGARTWVEQGRVMRPARKIVTRVRLAPQVIAAADEATERDAQIGVFRARSPFAVEAVRCAIEQARARHGNLPGHREALAKKPAVGRRAPR